jgi:hypothetical protein
MSSDGYQDIDFIDIDENQYEESWALANDVFNIHRKQWQQQEEEDDDLEQEKEDVIDDYLKTVPKIYLKKIKKGNYYFWVWKQKALRWMLNEAYDLDGDLSSVCGVYPYVDDNPYIDDPDTDTDNDRISDRISDTDDDDDDDTDTFNYEYYDNFIFNMRKKIIKIIETNIFDEDVVIIEIRNIIVNGNINVLTINTIRNQLVIIFGELIHDKKAWIKDQVYIIMDEMKQI